jgi:two-component sensor histidine kinase
VQVQLPEPVAAVFITDQLARRALPAPDFLREKLAIQDLAQQMADHPSEVLPRLVRLAMEICGAESAGVSILEPESEQFRWFGLTGVLSTFEGATTPRNSSPCGVCLDLAQPILMERPERAYDWIREAGITVPEVLLVPLAVKEAGAIGTLWIVAGMAGHFNSEHARVVSELASFAGMALRMIQAEQRLNVALQQQETLTREMSHRIKNLFAIAESMLRMTARSASTKEELAETLSGRLHALAHANALVRRSFGDGVTGTVNFGELIARILRPHDHASSVLDGPSLAIGEQATNHLALVFHELATNAAKYGALTQSSGKIIVIWAVDGTHLKLTWKEEGGPAAQAPETVGFGTKLVETTIKRIGGEIGYDWQPSGLSVRISLPLGFLRS